ncbi:hypothetical protein ANCCEY_11818 [Ancylostoma ceylanicum]|uniref:Sulfotransferase domain-containing protein n=1 Tax=Ancylostoma ceylanicum TaxID=53326 RepID=A0A0D6LGN2_9BILA|nr:hypothetical protein ANCCEY_11818 [Ancylostoma ceylanicum]
MFSTKNGISIGPYKWILNEQALDPFLFNKTSVFPPFHRYREYFQDIPKYRLCTCFIEKVMSTIRDGIFCYLNDPVEFVSHNRRISTENYVNRRVKFAVVRDPIDRFLSGYADKCYP